MENQIQAQIVPEAVPTSTVTAAVNSLAGLNKSIEENGASNISKAVLPAILEGLSRAMKDPIFSGIDFSTKSVEEFMVGIAVAGDNIQRANLARHLSLACAHYFPGIYQQSTKSQTAYYSSLNFLKAAISNLCDHYGVKFVGNIESAANALLHDYGGISIVGFMMFFEGSKSGKYIGEFQHVAARGINYEFLKDWIDQFHDESEADKMAMYTQYKEPKVSQDEWPEESKKMIKAINDGVNVKKAGLMITHDTRRELESQANEIRGQWEKEIFEHRMFSQWFKTVEVETIEADGNGNERKVLRKKEILCDESDQGRQRAESVPIRVHLPGAVERLIKREIFEFITLGDSTNVDEIFSYLRDHILEKYDGNHDAVEPEMKAILLKVAEFRRTSGVISMMRANVLAVYPEASAIQVENTVAISLRQWSDHYFEVYLPECINRKYPALKMKDYVFQGTLFNFLENGNANPINDLMFA